MLVQLSQYSEWGVMALRIGVAAVFIVHGWPKIQDPKGIAKVYGAPAVVGTLHGLVEVLGGAALILGLFVREAALLLALIMLGAIYFKAVKWKMPFKSDKGTGWELDLVLLAANLYLLTM